jgi:hypothetical protein
MRVAAVADPRILLVTYNWPPRNTIATHRSYAWAKYWSEAGAKVTVLTARKIASDEPLDLNLPTLSGVRVVEVPFARAQMAVLTPLIKNSVIRKYLAGIRKFVRRNSALAIDPRAAWRDAARPYLPELVAGHDFVVSTYGPDTSHFIANDLMAIRPDLFWVADYRDLWSQNPMRPWSREIRDRMASLERASVGAHADLVTAVSEDMIVQLSGLFSRDFFMSMNGFDASESEVLSNIEQKDARESERPIIIAHTGSIYKGHTDPTPLLEAIAGMIEAGEIEADAIRVEFYGSNLHELDALAGEPRFRRFVHLGGYVDLDTSRRIQRNADLLLLLISDDPASKGIITGKVFEYMISGSPLLCLCPEGFEVRAVVDGTGVGVGVDGQDRKGIEKVLRDVIDRNRRPDWFAPRIQQIMEYSRKKLALSLLDEMVARRIRRQHSDRPTAS